MKHPDALISVATGRASGVVVLDIDVKHAGPNGWDALDDGRPAVVRHADGLDAERRNALLF